MISLACKGEIMRRIAREACNMPIANLPEGQIVSGLQAKLVICD